jgi:NAD(P)-dependent dehydrogenase (short-subunit alcohol dehydrogenase family)
MNSLANKSILVVGGGSGIGLATARRVAAAGAKPIIAGRSRERLDAALTALPKGARAEVLDFTDAASVASLAERIGSVDHLVLSASSAVAWGAFAELKEDAVRAGFENKFWGYWRVTKALAPKLSSNGALVLVTGAAGRAAIPGTSALAAVNAALAAAAQVLAVELAPRRVNVVSPGMTETEAYGWMNAPQRQAMFEGTAAKLPARRIGQPEDLADAIVFALSNPFLTGAVLDVDGGVHLPRG